jgi:hypothetical protein
MKKLLAASGIFLLFVFTGSIWISLVEFLPVGLPRSIVVVLLGVAFAGVFIWLLISQLRKILTGPDRLWLQVAIASFELMLLIMAFASAYRNIGVMDNTRPGSPITHAFTSSIYYSIVTFTTLGYGDFYPVGLGRALASIEALAGYIILGILASTGVSLLSPHQKPKLYDAEEEQS